MKNSERRIWTILDIVKWGTNYFNEKNIDSPRLTIELMLCHIMNIERVGIYTRFDEPLNENELSTLREMVKRRANHEPLQYILGSVNFYGLDLEVNKSVLIPRPETEQLVEEVINDYKNCTDSISILDIGTGTGCIAVALAKNLPQSTVLSVDISQDALSVAHKNASKFDLKNIAFEYCDILKNVPSKNNFDIIVTNPPYIASIDFENLEPELKNFEPRCSLTDEGDGLTFYRRFIKIFPELLKDEGKFYMEIGFGLSEMLKKLFDERGIIVSVKNDLSGIPRVVSGNFTT